MTDSVTLGVSTSGRTASLAIERDGQVTMPPPVAQRGANLHAELARACADAGVSPTSIRAVRVDLGPGSYTGLRVAVTLARFLGRFSNAATFATTSFELIGDSLKRAGHAGTLRVALDARRDHVHTAVVELNAPIRLLEPPRAITTAAFAELPRADHLLAADDSLSLQSALPIPDYDATALFSADVEPRATPLESLDPLYLMGSYAE